MIYQATDEHIQLASLAIRNGNVVAFPTETVYGLGANAFDATAVAKIFEIKNRPYFDPLIIHVNSIDMVNLVCTNMSDVARSCMEKFWPGPLTIVLPKSNVPDIVTAGLPTVAVRMPSNIIAQKLIYYAGVPIAAPSANPFGYLSPTTALHVERQLGTSIDIILDGGPCSIGVESTIIKVVDEKVLLLRFGGLPVEEIEAFVGKVHLQTMQKVESPGQLPYHYAPKTKITIVHDISSVPDNSSCALLLFKKRDIAHKHTHILSLSDNGDMCQAATNLFSCLHELDTMDVDIIYVEEVPQVGLGRAIMERLKKAQARFT